MNVKSCLLTVAVLVGAVVLAIASLYQPLVFVGFIVIVGPFAFYRKFINKRTRTVGTRPYIAGRDCPTCGGWGQVNGQSCTGTCGGRKTR